ncbi:MAG: contractile injection system tape measure protein, partial [Vicinamibacterales bacterium]
MLDGRHNLRRETLRVSVSSEALALAVRPRLESLNHAVLLPLVETVLDEFAEPDVHVRLDRLDLDLGTIDAADLDRLVPLRLADALRRQLATALQREGARTGAPRPSIRTATEARLDAVEYFLASGTLPFWVSPGTFDLDEVFGRLLDTAAGDLAALVRRLGLQSAALGRLILHLGDATLRRLLKALSPDEAAVILVYLTEIRDYHAIEPLIPVSDRKLARILWSVAFE